MSYPGKEVGREGGQGQQDPEKHCLRAEQRKINY